MEDIALVPVSKGGPNNVCPICKLPVDDHGSGRITKAEITCQLLYR